MTHLPREMTGHVASQKMRPGLVRLIVLGAMLCSTAGFLFYERELPVPEGAIPKVDRTGDYVSADTCKKCHPGAHASWHDTFHRTMTQVVSPETVAGDFDGRDYEVEGRGPRLQAHRQRLHSHLQQGGEARAGHLPKRRATS